MEQAALFLWFMLLACTTTLVQCTNKSIFIVSGQSNMIGLGGVTNGVWDKIVPHECQSNPKILRLNNDSQWEIAREPLHQGIGQLLQGCGIGPGMPFANSVLKPGETIGLVPWAVGGTNIDQWQRGTSNYNHTVTRAQAAVSNGGGVIRAMLWFQGEADTYYVQRADAYKGKLVQFFNDLRDDLRSPSLPIFQVVFTD